MFDFPFKKNSINRSKIEKIHTNYKKSINLFKIKKNMSLDYL